MDPTIEESRPLYPGGIPDRPLFGVSNKKDRLINLAVGCITALLFFITFICSFVAQKPVNGLHVFFAICICFVLISQLVLIYWYRQGDLDPKFRILIYYNAFTIVALSICGLIFFFNEVQT